MGKDIGQRYNLSARDCRRPFILVRPEVLDQPGFTAFRVFKESSFGKTARGDRGLRGGSSAHSLWLESSTPSIMFDDVKTAQIETRFADRALQLVRFRGTQRAFACTRGRASRIPEPQTVKFYRRADLMRGPAKAREKKLRVWVAARVAITLT
jgi:hypothetical protein